MVLAFYGLEVTRLARVRTDGREAWLLMSEVGYTICLDFGDSGRLGEMTRTLFREGVAHVQAQ